jgi:hypothetical protein
MTRKPILSEGAAARYPLPFRPGFVRVAVSPRHPGVYLLLRRGRPIYIGRSDRCVRARLARHPYLGRADQFVWYPCRSAVHAFYLESFWYHALREEGVARNLIHPARPAGSGIACPFCSDVPETRLVTPPVATALGRAFEISNSDHEEVA